MGLSPGLSSAGLLALLTQLIALSAPVWARRATLESPGEQRDVVYIDTATLLFCGELRTAVISELEAADSAYSVPLYCAAKALAPLCSLASGGSSSTPDPLKALVKACRSSKSCKKAVAGSTCQDFCPQLQQAAAAHSLSVPDLVLQLTGCQEPPAEAGAQELPVAAAAAAGAGGGGSGSTVAAAQTATGGSGGQGISLDVCLLLTGSGTNKFLEAQFESFWPKLTDPQSGLLKDPLALNVANTWREGWELPLTCINIPVPCKPCDDGCCCKWYKPSCWVTNKDVCLPPVSASARGTITLTALRGVRSFGPLNVTVYQTNCSKSVLTAKVNLQLTAKRLEVDATVSGSASALGINLPSVSADATGAIEDVMLSINATLAAKIDLAKKEACGSIVSIDDIDMEYGDQDFSLRALPDWLNNALDTVVDKASDLLDRDGTDQFLEHVAGAFSRGLTAGQLQGCVSNIF